MQILWKIQFADEDWNDMKRVFDDEGLMKQFYFILLDYKALFSRDLSCLAEVLYKS